MATSKSMSTYSSIHFSQEFRSSLNSINGKYPILSSEEEKVLRNQLAAGSLEARDKLVFSSLNYVIKQAKKNSFVTNENIEDVVFGTLIEMLDKAFSYDPSHNTKFLTFMSHIIDNAIWNLACPATTHDRRFIREYNAVVSRLGKENATDKAVADALGMKTATVTDLRKRIDRATYSYSFEGSDSDDDDERGSFIENMLHGEDSNPESEFMLWNAYQTLDKAIARLPKRQQLIINLSWGLLPGKPEHLSLRQIAEKTGIGRMTVCNLKNQAEDSIRQYMEDAGYSDSFAA